MNASRCSPAAAPVSCGCGRGGGGDLVRVHGERSSSSPDRAGVCRVAARRRRAPRRLGGRRGAGSAAAVASNRVRPRSNAARSALPPDDSALFRGLVIGDDRDQPPAMLERFRTSGLAHLTAVSGQNVSFVIAAAGPLLSTSATVGALGGDDRPDRLVREPHQVRAVDRAGRHDGGDLDHGVCARPRPGAVPRVVPRRHGAGARRPAAAAVDRVLALGRGDGRCVHGRAVARQAAVGPRHPRRHRSASRSAPNSVWRCRACSCSDGSRWSASRPTCWRCRSPGS